MQMPWESPAIDAIPPPSLCPRRGVVSETAPDGARMAQGPAKCKQERPALRRGGQGGPQGDHTAASDVAFPRACSVK